VILLAITILTVYTACTALAYATTFGEDDFVSNLISYPFMILLAVVLLLLWRSPVFWGALLVAGWLRWNHQRYSAILSITGNGE
jgi:hypothetical protein